jgi:outer membrane protein
MKRLCTQGWTLAVSLAVLLPTAGPAWASGMSVDIIPNFVGLGLGVTTQWMGSSDMVGGIVPGGRVQFSTHRFAEMYGPMLDANVLDIPNWEFGPMLSYRIGRRDVDDPVVNQLPPIGGGWEAGAIAGYHFVHAGSIPWRWRVGVSATTAISGDATGGHVTPYTSFWMPLSRTVFVGVGAGVTWSTASFMAQRFSVTPADSAASGLPEYAAGSGMRQVYAWPAVIIRLSERWFAGAGAFYQRLTGDAADSPIVTERGSPNQWTTGFGIGYAWE